MEGRGGFGWMEEYEIGGGEGRRGKKKEKWREIKHR